MSLNVLTVTPSNNSINIPIDNNIVITFDSNLDPFSILNGITLYTENQGLWSGPDLALLDTKYRDVLDFSTDYVTFPVTYTVTNNTVTLTPTIPLLPNKEYFVSIFPGNNAERFVSTITVQEPEYTRDGTSTGTVNITSSYTGTTNGTYLLTFTGARSFSASFGATYLDDYSFTTDNEVVNLGNIKISFTGTFDSGDIIEIDVVQAGGLSSIVKTSFTTSSLTTTVPISDKLKELVLDSDLYIVQTIPQNLSINNAKCNPITIKFNKNIDPSQDIINKIIITKKSFDARPEKIVSYYYKITNNIIKIYLTNVVSN